MAFTHAVGLKGGDWSYLTAFRLSETKGEEGENVRQRQVLRVSNAVSDLRYATQMG